MSLQLPLSPGRRLIGAYAELPAVSGRSFLPISFLGRLPATMTPLAILTFVATSTGSYAAAGLATTATAAGSAVGAPLMGRVADRCGQRPVLVVAALVNALALILLARSGPDRATLLVLCALTGLSIPQVGGMARARWLALSRPHAGTAMAFEGTADELAYVLGPAAAGLLAVTWGPASALLTAALGGLVVVGAFAVHPTQASTPGTGRLPRVPAGSRREPGLLSRMLFPTLAMLLMGMFFAAAQTAVTVSATEAGHPSAGAIIYAVMAVGSAATALGTAALPPRFGPRQRCLVAASGLLAGTLLMAAAGTVALVCAAVLLTGLAVGPMLVTLNQLAGEAAPVGRTATAMACLSTGSVIGVALGATASGALADGVGSLGAFAVTAAASTVLLVLCLIGLRSR